MLELPEGVCGWHRGHFVHLISNPPTNHSSLDRQVGRGGESRYPIQAPPTASPFLRLTPGWWSIPSLLCFHCKKVNTILPYLSNYAGKLDGGESMKALCDRTARWGRCRSCDGCDACALLVVECLVRIAKGFAQQGTDVEMREEDEIFEGEPSRFVIYRVGGEIWVREWKTSTYLTSHPQRSGFTNAIHVRLRGSWDWCNISNSISISL
jgi:hypothetical protein